MAGGKRHLWGVRCGFDIADTDLTDHSQRPYECHALYALLGCMDSRWPMVPMIAFSLWIMSHPPRRMLCWQVEVDGAADWWPLEARARAEQWLPLIFMHTVAPHELRCATDAVGAAKGVGAVEAVEPDAASLISKCESQSSRHTHTNKHTHTHIQSESGGANKRNIFLARRRR